MVIWVIGWILLIKAIKAVAHLKDSFERRVVTRSLVLGHLAKILPKYRIPGTQTPVHL